MHLCVGKFLVCKDNTKMNLSGFIYFAIHKIRDEWLKWKNTIILNFGRVPYIKYTNGHFSDIGLCVSAHQGTPPLAVGG